MGQIRINMLGTDFTIQAANGNDEYLQKLVGYYDKIATDVEKSGIKNPLKAAIIAGINICDELYKEKENKIAMENGLFPTPSENSFDTVEIERRTKEMINKIDKVL